MWRGFQGCGDANPHPWQCVRIPYCRPLPLLLPWLNDGGVFQTCIRCKNLRRWTLDSFVSTQALASCVVCDFQPIPAQLHAAPASRPLLAGVMKVHYTVSTLADTVAIDIGEQYCRAVRQRGKQV